jgi:hypothetical protein
MSKSITDTYLLTLYIKSSFVFGVLIPRVQSYHPLYSKFLSYVFFHLIAFVLCPLFILKCCPTYQIPYSITFVFSSEVPIIRPLFILKSCPMYQISYSITFVYCLCQSFYPMHQEFFLYVRSSCLMYQCSYPKHPDFLPTAFVCV